MYEEYIGKKMHQKDIFNTFIDMAAVGEPDSNNFLDIYVTIRFIGSPEEAEKFQKSGRYCICHGRLSRKGEGTIWNSTITLQELVGIWNTSVTADGSQSDETLVFKQHQR